MSHASNKRLAKESQMINKDPPPFCYARPKEDNILEWHYILRESPSEATTTGSMTATSSDRAKLASLSHKWNTQEKKFCAVFPEYSKEAVMDLPNMGQAMGGKLAIDPSVAQASESEAREKDSSKVRSVNGQSNDSSSKTLAVPVRGAKDMKAIGVATNGTTKAAEGPARAQPLGFFSSYTNMAISLLLALFLARLFSKLT
ncbi:Ubiquitin-protein ligase [Ceraceosorus bombacis]|uniref:Ubiquitin-protein ligase n=1 Tax=Ceraceosorus bombacis TaxID=401625 RepID=A0A0P1BE05_9BASI|nr:Ubiquitin-protein ligase [Ceraceosorus bombacis]